MTYYGQWETDKVIEEYFPQKTNGFCVEVGAYDGIKGSNTNYFENIGWACMCIEPNPHAFRELYYNRTLSYNVNVACDSFGGRADLEIFHFNSGIQSSLTSLNTDSRLVKDYCDAITKRTFVNVPVTKLSILLSDWLGKRQADFISIDTEGTELQVLHGLDFEIHRPKLLVVENNYNDRDIENYLRPHGYVLDRRYRINDFYVQE